MDSDDDPKRASFKNIKDFCPCSYRYIVNNIKNKIIIENSDFPANIYFSGIASRSPPAI